MAITVKYCHEALGKICHVNEGTLAMTNKIVELAVATKVKYCHGDLGKIDMLIRVNFPSASKK